MYARMVIGSIPPERLDSAVQLWRETVLPSARRQQGFRGVRLVIDRTGGRIATMALWESEAAFQATVEWNKEQVARFAEFFSSPPDIGGYEVVEDVRVAESTSQGG